MLLIGIMIVTIAFLWGSVGFLMGKAVGYGEGLKDGIGIRGYFVEPPPIRKPKDILDMGPFGTVAIMPIKEEKDVARKEDQRENQKG